MTVGREKVVPQDRRMTPEHQKTTQGHQKTTQGREKITLEHKKADQKQRGIIFPSRKIAFLTKQNCCPVQQKRQLVQ